MSRLSWLLSNSIKMAVPAGIYLAMNMLGFVSLHRIDAGTFAVVQQSKIFFTALFGRLFLGRILSQPKWCALVCLVLGVLLITLEAQPSSQACHTHIDTERWIDRCIEYVHRLISAEKMGLGLLSGRNERQREGETDLYRSKHGPRPRPIGLLIHLLAGVRRPRGGAQRCYVRQPALVRCGCGGRGARFTALRLRDRLL